MTDRVWEKGALIDVVQLLIVLNYYYTGTVDRSDIR
jgi:hypothetical protein